MYRKKPHILIVLELSSSIIHAFYPYSVFYIFLDWYVSFICIHITYI